MTATVRWVSCAKELSWATSRYRHVLRANGLDTICGATGTHKDVWRGNSTKPACLVCAASQTK